MSGLNIFHGRLGFRSHGSSSSGCDSFAAEMVPVSTFVSKKGKTSSVGVVHVMYSGTTKVGTWSWRGENVEELGICVLTRPEIARGRNREVNLAFPLSKTVELARRDWFACEWRSETPCPHALALISRPTASPSCLRL